MMDTSLIDDHPDSSQTSEINERTGRQTNKINLQNSRKAGRQAVRRIDRQ